MDLPNALYLDCPSCGEETLHKVIKGKIGEKKGVVIEALVKCKKCGHTHQSVIKPDRSVKIPVIVSDQAASLKNQIELSENETINVGNEYVLGRDTIKITSIEADKKRVKSSLARDATTLWAKKFDRIKLNVSVNKGTRTLKRTIWAVPDEEFFIGDVMRLKGLDVAIHSIKTRDRNIKKGGAVARDIVRLYAKIIR